MFIYKFLAKFCIAFLLFSVVGCSIRANPKTVTYLIPENFEGGVVIVYAQKDGVTPDVTENEIVFTVPADGVLKVNVDAKAASGKPRFFFIGKNGERSELELLYHWGPKYPCLASNGRRLAFFTTENCKITPNRSFAFVGDARTSSA